VHILIVDDDPLNCKLVKFILGEEGYEVAAAGSTEAAFAHLESYHPDLFILDVMMPHTDGFELCKKLRSANSDAVILFLTAKGELTDRVSGLELGADDYLVKPFEPAELVARVKALARRYQRFQEAPYTTHLKAGNVELHVSDLEAMINGRDGTRLVGLTPTEMRLLRCLMVNADRVVSRNVLLDSIWGYGDNAGGSQVIDVYIRRLRKKIEEDASNPSVIESIRGSGYKFNASSVEAA
jgi:DNA-binding response OmpR family regulator